MAISIAPLCPALGAEIGSFDVTRIATDAVREILEAWHCYLVLVVRDQDISEDEQIDFARCFGRVELARTRSPLASRPEIMIISNIKKNGEYLGRLPVGEMAFHSDRVHQEIPNKAGVLYAVDVPKVGGNTRFLNMHLAYEALNQKIKQRIEGLRALNTYDYGTTQAGGKQSAAGAPAAIHPIVRTIPETGRKALFISRLMTDRIIGLPNPESRRLLDELLDHCEQPQFIYEHRWCKRDLLIWDNRCVLHARTDFNPTEPRLLKRVTVGDSVRPS